MFIHDSEKKSGARKYEIYIHVYSEQVECFIQGSEREKNGQENMKIYNHVYSEQVKCLFRIQRKIWTRKYDLQPCFILSKSSVFIQDSEKKSGQENIKFTTLFILSKSSVQRKIWARKYEIYNPVYSPIL